MKPEELIPWLGKWVVINDQTATRALSLSWSSIDKEIMLKTITGAPLFDPIWYFPNKIKSIREIKRND